jgi:cell division protease FtsH
MASPQHEPSRPDSPPPDLKQFWRTNGFWWVILLGLLIWNMIAFWPTQRPEVQIPYTTFLAQIRAGNVTSVHIVGDAITGAFAHPFQWPPTASNATPNASSGTPDTSTPTSATSGTSSQPVAATKQHPATHPTTAPARQATPTGSPAPRTYLAFRTTFPAAIGDPGLLPLLEQHDVVVTVTTPSTPWFITLLVDGFPMLLLIGFFVWMGRRAAKQQGTMFGFGRTKARRYTSDHPEVTFTDVAGADEAKADLQEEVDFLRHPQKYHDVGARIPRGVLLVGPPGTGKTLLARAVAGEAEVPFFNLSASEFVEMFVGVGASRVRDLFQQAKAAAPAIVFIDELDAVGRRRGAGVGMVNDEREQTLNQLLVEMDGFDERHEVIVLAATNRPDVLDPALLRPGRFDRQVMVELPDQQGREGILQIHTRHVHLGPDVDVRILAQSTIGMSGADLANLCNEAALIAARHNHHQVSMADFEEALDKVVLGQKRHALADPHERRVVATHEAGHTLVAWLTPGADPVHKVTIVSHGRALGVTTQLPSAEHYNYSHTYLMARLAVMLGGRTSEEVVFGEVTTGAENDLVEATRLARHMVTRWGMGTLGVVAFQDDEEHPFLGYRLAQGRSYSEATAACIDQDVQRLLKECHANVCQLLRDARKSLDQLTEALLQEETLDQNALRSLLGPPPEAPATVTAVHDRKHAGASGGDSGTGQQEACC